MIFKLISVPFATFLLSLLLFFLVEGLHLTAKDIFPKPVQAHGIITNHLGRRCLLSLDFLLDATILLLIFFLYLRHVLNRREGVVGANLLFAGFRVSLALWPYEAGGRVISLEWINFFVGVNISLAFLGMHLVDL